MNMLRLTARQKHRASRNIEIGIRIVVTRSVKRDNNNNKNACVCLSICILSIAASRFGQLCIRTHLIPSLRDATRRKATMLTEGACDTLSLSRYFYRAQNKDKQKNRHHRRVFAHLARTQYKKGRVKNER